MDGRLIVRAFEKSDAAALHQLLNKPALLERRYLDDEEDRDPFSLVQVEDLLEKWTKAGGRTHRAVMTRQEFYKLREDLADRLPDPFV